jgi:hypothetical protein
VSNTISISDDFHVIAITHVEQELLTLP